MQSSELAQHYRDEQRFGGVDLFESYSSIAAEDIDSKLRTADTQVDELESHAGTALNALIREVSAQIRAHDQGGDGEAPPVSKRKLKQYEKTLQSLKPKIHNPRVKADTHGYVKTVAKAREEMAHIEGKMGLAGEDSEFTRHLSTIDKDAQALNQTLGAVREAFNEIVLLGKATTAPVKDNSAVRKVSKQLHKLELKKKDHRSIEELRQHSQQVQTVSAQVKNAVEDQRGSLSADAGKLSAKLTKLCGWFTTNKANLEAKVKAKLPRAMAKTAERHEAHISARNDVILAEANIRVMDTLLEHFGSSDGQAAEDYLQTQVSSLEGAIASKEAEIQALQTEHRDLLAADPKSLSAQELVTRAGVEEKLRAAEGSRSLATQQLASRTTLLERHSKGELDAKVVKKERAKEKKKLSKLQGKDKSKRRRLERARKNQQRYVDAMEGIHFAQTPPMIPRDESTAEEYIKWIRDQSAHYEELRSLKKKLD